MQHSDVPLQTDSGLSVFTIGHSTHSIERFLGLLQAHEIALLVDIRSFPGSRYVPQFNAEQLAETLSKAGMAYRHLQALGGRRKELPHSINTGWKNASFRGFADYMQTAHFEEGLQELITLAMKQHTCIMCAEALPWRCHRSLVADALLVRDIQVWHIMPDAHLAPHVLTRFAQVKGTQVWYPASDV
ncbi:MAG: DUF488 domain-containing protein [Thermoflavifilum sp.]|nr:DUF488 domain-containing protein [Thermoflavifilum sp.]